VFIERKCLYKIKQRRPLFGVGINDANYVVKYKNEEGKLVTCPYYAVWSGMVERCFSTKLQQRRPTYKGCTLEESWKTFSNFKTWMQNQDWQGKELDKDLISWDNKHYGPDTCLFISTELNNLLCLRSRHRGKLPLGVSKTKIKGYEYFIASCSFYGIQKRLGYFKTVEEAAAAYKKAKLEYIAALAQKETEPKVREALVNLW
jgi:hypothetical protein